MKHKATSIIPAKTKPDDERSTCIELSDLNVRGMLKKRMLLRRLKSKI